MTEMVIQTSSLGKHFGRKWALKDFSLSVNRGGIHAVVGSNGAGKSTLFRILLGLQSATCGHASILGQDCRSLTPAVRGRIGYVNEEHTLPGWMVVKDVKAMQKSLYPRWGEGVYREVADHFDVAPGQKVGALSRGERAGFNLAMALAQNPEILILDEPTLGLDVVAKRAFLESLLFNTSANADTASTIIYCSHQMDEVERVADQLIIMEQGRMRIHASPDEFLTRVTCWSADAGQLDGPLAHPAILSQRIIDGQIHLYVFDHNHSFDKELQLAGARSIRQGSVSLDQAINAFLAKHHHRASSVQKAA